jgi:peroxiredoxin
VDGKEKTITTNGDYPQVDGELVNTETEMVQEGYTPPIHDFTMERGGEDYTTKFLNEKNLIVVVAYSLSNTEKDGFIPIREVTDKALKDGYDVIGLSASSQEMTEALAEQYKLNFKFYFCDETTLKTIVRSNPGILELDKGTVKQKLHWNDASKLKLHPLKNANPKLDLPLKQRLDSIAVLDQKYRKLMQAKTMDERKQLGEKMGLTEAEYSGDLGKMQSILDSVNMIFIEEYFQKKGYPGKSVVGEGTNLVAWNVLQHNPDRINLYLPLIKKAAEAGEIPKTSYAMMQDRYLMMHEKPQLYGTQGMTYDDERGSFIWPIEDPETVNQRRAAAGFDETIEEYAKVLFGDDFVYQPHTMEQINGN